MVVGGDSCVECCGFESQHHLLDGHFFTKICCKIVYLKRRKNEKEDGDGPFLNKKVLHKNPASNSWWLTIN